MSSCTLHERSGRKTLDRMNSLHLGADVLAFCSLVVCGESLDRDWPEPVEFRHISVDPDGPPPCLHGSRLLMMGTEAVDLTP